MTYTVVAQFADRASADRAAADVSGAALEAKVHERPAAAANAGAVEADEYLTGGIVAQFGHLLDGLLDSSPPRGDAATYRELLETKGTIVSVRTDDAAVAKDACARLEAAGAKRAAVLPQPGLESD